MSEFFFVIKTLAITVVIALLMQIKISGSTIEERTEKFLYKSNVSMWIQGAASGGALAINHAAHSAKDAVSKAAEVIDEKTARAERASR